MSDTIAAISTGLSESGISIVRMSGDKAVDIADVLFVNKNKLHTLKDSGSHKLNYGFFCHGEKILDEVLVSVMKGPNSYTGEDIVEINCHGGIYITSVILDVLLKNGAVLASPGEFTKRAFLNGRLDLTQAEAVMDIIASSNESARVNSLSQLSGRLKERILNLRELLLGEIAYIEAALDDPEHYDLEGYTDELYEKANVVITDINELCNSYNDGRLIKSGIRTIILGKPNAGKSSLMNILSDNERAIVTSIPGTTRDILESDIKVNDIPVTLIDTAGIRDTEDEIEKIGIDRSFKALDECDLCIYVLDSSVLIDDNDKRILFELCNKDKKIIYVLNKSDLFPLINKNDVCGVLSDNNIDYDLSDIIVVSAKTGDGLNDVKKRISDLFFKGKILSSSDEIFITNKRQYSYLNNALESISLVIEGINNGFPEDIYVTDMTECYKNLGFIIGEEIGEDVINEVFSRFCMGK